jgi:(p)ppGpp synthase/HD superfamily hydrolase
VALSPRFTEALVWAAQRHAAQVRHNTATPYISHLLSTCAIVLEEGGDERLAVAALLHDVLEDTDTTRAELRERFGAEVYRVVDDCTDADRGERAGVDWRERKRTHLERVARAGAGSLLVIAADKVCSLQSLVDDLVRFGPALFDRSARSAPELLGNYRDFHEVLRSGLGDRPVVRRLAALIEECSTMTAKG